MSLSAHYVTQSSVYSSPYTGRLTDRRIRHYEKLGYYGKVAKEERREERKKRLSKKKVFAKFDF